MWERLDVWFGRSTSTLRRETPSCAVAPKFDANSNWRRLMRQKKRWLTSSWTVTVLQKVGEFLAPYIFSLCLPVGSLFSYQLHQDPELHLSSPSTFFDRLFSCFSRVVECSTSDLIPCLAYHFPFPHSRLVYSPTIPIP